MKIINPVCRKMKDIDYNIFYAALNKLNLQSSLQVFKDATLVKCIADLGLDLFNPLIENIKKEINNPLVAISVLDIPINDTISREDDAFLGIAASLSIIWNLFSPSIDSANLTPFTVYTASRDNAQKLEEAQLPHNIPEVKLGFHNDGRIEGNSILIPDVITLYNILISYRRPGNFHWIPFSQWNEMQKFSELFGVGKKYKFKIIPSVYAKPDDQLDVHGPNEIIAPVFSQKGDNELIMFLNGEIIGTESGSDVSNELILKLKKSLSMNPVRFCVEQKARRLILLGNSLGCHARDIFEEPINDSQLTRAFIRSVDTKGISLNM